MLKAQIVDENGARVLESETGSVVARVYNILMDGAGPLSSVAVQMAFEEVRRKVRGWDEERSELIQDRDRLKEENDDLKEQLKLVEELATSRLVEIKDIKDQLKLWQKVARCKDKMVVNQDIKVEKTCRTCRFWQADEH